MLYLVCCRKEGDLNRRCHNQINRMLNWFVHLCPPAEDCSSLWMNLFSATSEVLFVQSISVVLHSKLLTLEDLNVRFWSIFVCLYSLFSYTSPSANLYRFSNRCSVCFFKFFFLLYWGSGDLLVWLEVWILSLSVYSKPTSLCKCLHLGAQRPDLSRLIKEPWCLLCSVPPHCAVAILNPDIFYMSHTSPTTKML